jgi:uncharacterized protein YjdB
MVSSTTIINAITSIAADPFTKAISYQYTPINIGDIIARITALEKNASIIDISDTITLYNEDGSQFINDSISLLVGKSKTIKYSTLSGFLTDAVSSASNIASLSRNDADTTITITAASELTAGDDNKKTSKIVLTSYNGLINDNRYTSTSSTVYAYVEKNSQTISYGNTFTGNLTVNKTTPLTINGAHTKIVATAISSNIEVNVSGNTVNITPKDVGTGSFSVYAESSTTYKKSNTKTINVIISAQKIEPTGISLNKTTHSFSGSGSTIKLTYTLTPNDANTNTAVTFTSNDKSVATVTQDGVVKPADKGTTTIVATTANNKTAECSINVEPGTVELVTVSPPSEEFSSAGGTVTITATVNHNCFTEPTITWTHTGNGNFEGGSHKASGKTVKYTANANEDTATNANSTITATCGNKSATCKVTVLKKEVQLKYYWYVGQENPANMTSISPIVSDTSSPGWRYIGNTKPTSSTFTSTNMLWNGDTNNISFGSRIISYIAIPYKPLQMWDVTGGDGLFYTIQNNGNPVNINGVDYYVYMSDYKIAAFTMNIYNK